MYEWRIFQKLNFLSQKDFEEYLHKIWMPSVGYFIEPRNDIYFIIPSNINHDFGLKLRDIKLKEKKQKYQGKKLELKIKYSSNNQIEQWKKIISQKMKKKIELPYYQQYDKYDQNNLGQTYQDQILIMINELVRCLQIINDTKLNEYIDILKQYANNNQVKLILVTKYQCKTKDEQTVIKIADIKSKQIQYFNTCSVEEYKLEDHNIDQMILQWEKKYSQISNGFIMGYPEFLQKFY